MKKRVKIIMVLLMCVILLGLASGILKEKGSAQTQSQEEYIADCIEGFNYDEYLRYDDYKGQRVKLVLDVQQIINDSQYYCTDCNGHEYVVNDRRKDMSMKILEGDVIITYGEYVGAQKYQRVWSNEEDGIFTVDTKYIDVWSGDSALQYYKDLEAQYQREEYRRRMDEVEQKKSCYVTYERTELSDFINYSYQEIVPTFEMEGENVIPFGQTFEMYPDEETDSCVYCSEGGDIKFVIGKDVRTIILKDSTYDNRIYGMQIADKFVPENIPDSYSLVNENSQSDDERYTYVYRVYSDGKISLLIKTIEWGDDITGEVLSNIEQIILTKESPSNWEEYMIE